MPTFVSPFTGTVVTPTDVSYFYLAFSADQQLAWPASVNPPEVPAARIIDCVASAAGLTISLPRGDEGTQGADILIRNLGSFSFIVEDYLGGETVTVDPGVSKYIYLTDNTTEAGTWANVTFAAGTSFADATTLAGFGLTSLGGKLALSQNLIDITSSPTIDASSRAATFVWNAGAGTLNLPVPSTLSTGWFIGFRNNGTGTLAIDAPTPALINGLSSIETNPGDSGFIMYDVTTLGYITIGWQTAQNISFTAATYDVDAVPGNTLNLTSFAPIIQTYIAQSGTRTQTLEVTLPAITQVYILVNNTNELGYNVSFVNEGSLQPPVQLSAGNTLIVLSDGQTLYVLSQTTTNAFYAVNGSATVPSYSFASDTATGMYLVGTSVLGLTANGTQIAQFDNSNLLQPLVNINARLVADLINGGTY